MMSKIESNRLDSFRHAVNTLDILEQEDSLES